MDWVTFSVQWLHVLLGIVWFGYSLALAIFFIPAISRLSIPSQRQIGAALGEHAKPIIDVIAPSSGEADTERPGHRARAVRVARVSGPPPG